MTDDIQSEIISEKMKGEFRFFNELSNDELMDFISFCEHVRIKEGENLWKEGDHDNSAAFLLSGKLGIVKKTEFEGKHMIVGTFEKGTVVGELCLLTDQVRSVTAVILKDVEAVVLSSDNFEKLISKHPMLGLKLLKKIFLLTTRRLNKSYDRMAALF